MAHGPRKTPLDFGGNQAHVMLGLGLGLDQCRIDKGGACSVQLKLWGSEPLLLYSVSFCCLSIAFHGYLSISIVLLYFEQSLLFLSYL